MDSKAHKHVPYIVPLFLALQKWRAENDNAWPNRKGKEEIRKIISSMRRFDDEENFDEAEEKINASLRETVVPGNLNNFFNSSVFTEKVLNPSTSPFWLLMKVRLLKY